MHLMPATQALVLLLQLLSICLPVWAGWKNVWPDRRFTYVLHTWFLDTWVELAVARYSTCTEGQAEYEEIFFAGGKKNLTAR